MDNFLEFARGPLFTATFTFMILGLFRVVYLQSLQLHANIKKLAYCDFSLWKNVKSFISWLVPVGHIYKNRWLGALSFSFHVGLLIVPVFLLAHIDLWKRGIGISWPALSMRIADVLTLITLGSGSVLLLYRIFNRGVRCLSRGSDYLLLILLMAPFASGFIAVHPRYNPFSYNAVMLVHLLSSELIFVLIPCTKLAHCVLFFFDRISSDIYWKMPVGAGDRVAQELHGKEARV